MLLPCPGGDNQRPSHFVLQKLGFSTICWGHIFLSSLTVKYHIVTSNRKFSILLWQFYSFPGAVALALCRTMVTMATQIPSVLTPLRGEIVSHFAKVVVSADDDSQESKDLVVRVLRDRCHLKTFRDINFHWLIIHEFYLLIPQVGMATLIFQSYRGISPDEDQSLIAKLDDLLLGHLGKLTTPSRYWTMFRVGKQATRQVLSLKSCFK